MNTFLAWVLRVKIAATLLLWALPALLISPECFEQFGFPEPKPILWVRLMGMAFTSLALGYWHGLQALRQGIFPLGTVQVGILSNGGACALLLTALLGTDLEGWTRGAVPYLWLSAGLTSAITVSLLACLWARR